MDKVQAVDLQQDNSAHTHLHGLWLIGARILWLLLVGSAITLFVDLIPRYHNIFNRLYGNVNVLSLGRLSLDGYNALKDLGISIETYAGLITGIFFFIAGSSLFVGSLIFFKRSNDWMAILVSLFLILSGAFFPMLLNEASLSFSGGSQTLETEWQLSVWVIMVTTTLIMFVLFMALFPDGRFLPRSMVLFAGINITLALSIFTSFDFRLYQLSIFNWPNLLIMLYLVQLFGFSLAAQIYRYLHVSNHIQRQQTKWLILGFAVVLIAFLVFVAPSFLIEGGTPGIIKTIGDILMLLSLAAIPVTVGLSVFRYRLWDIDFVINRGLAYSVLTLLLGTIFAGGFFGLRAALEGFLGGGQANTAAIISTALVVRLFTPVRRRSRRFIDQRFYGIEIEYQTPPASQHIVVSDLTRTSLGEFRNLQPIGSGGMAEVYRAQHPTLNRAVAVKVLPKRLVEEAEFRKRFQREAQVVAQLKHPNIVQMFDFGEIEGTPYMAMEYIEGQDLSSLIRSAGKLLPEQAQTILTDIAAALDYAHEQGLVHRDIKPSNVMLEPVTEKEDNRLYRAVLMDFGIARIITSMTQLTGTGGMVGTFDYIAPEQIQGASMVDGRADIYSMGVMAYQILTGELPFKHNNPGATLMAHIMQPPPDPREIQANLPENTANAVMQAMNKKPEERFSTAGEMVAALI